MEAQQADGGVGFPQPAFADEGQEPIPDLVALARKAADSHARPGQVEPHRPRSIEDVQVLVRREQRVGERRPLVVARHEHYRDSPVRDLEQRLDGLRHQPGADLAAEQQVATVDYEIRLARERR